MLTAHQLTKSYGLHTVLQNITFSISVGERLGLIGPNGWASHPLRFVNGSRRRVTGNGSALKRCDDWSRRTPI